MEMQQLPFWSHLKIMLMMKMSPLIRKMKEVDDGKEEGERRGWLQRKRGEGCP